MMTEIERLREQLDELREENRQLRDEIGIVDTFPDYKVARVAGIPRKEFYIMNLLASRPLVRRETMVSVIWNDPTKDGPINPLGNIGVYLNRLRPKLEKYGIEIENVRNVGWRMDDESRKRTKELISELVK